MADSTGFFEIEILIDGSPIGDDPKHRAGNLRMVQDLEDHHKVEVEFYTLMVADRGDYGAAELDELQDKIGKAIELKWVEPRSGAEQKWKGLLSGAEARVDEQGAYSVTIRASSLSIKLDANPMNRVFNEVKLSDVVSQLCGDVGVEVSCDSTKTTYKQLVMSGESPYRFLRRTLAAEGLFFFYDGVEGKMNATAKPALGEVEMSVQDDLRSFSLSADVKPMLSTVTSWDEAAAKPLVSAITPEKANVKLADITMKASKELYSAVGDRDPEIQGQSLAALEEDSKGLAKTYASRMFRGHGTSVRVGVRAGTTVKIKGVSDKFSGAYLVTRATHTLDAKGYANDFECRPAAIAGPRRFPKPAQPLLRTGIVTNLDAPDQQGYAVKVKWVNSHGGTTDETESDWLRVALPHAGKDHGFAMLPEIDDEVVVAFEAGDLSHGVVLGSLYNGKNKTPAEDIGGELPDNNHKLFTTRSGHKMLFSDADGDEFIEITTKDEKCSIKLNVAGPDITIVTQGELKVTADKAMTFESQDAIKFKASKNIELEAQGDISAKATGKTNIEGMEVNTNAKMKSSLKAGMQVEVKGGSGTVKASVAGVDVQGPLVKLN